MTKNLFNPQFGSIFRTCHNPTYFSRRLCRFSDRSLHGFPQLYVELWPELYVLSAPHPSPAWGAAVDGPAVHGLQENSSSGWDVSDTMKAVGYSLTHRISYFSLGQHLKKSPKKFLSGCLSYFYFFLSKNITHNSLHRGKQYFSTLWPTYTGTALEGAVAIESVQRAFFFLFIIIKVFHITGRCTSHATYWYARDDNILLQPHNSNKELKFYKCERVIYPFFLSSVLNCNQK